MKFFSREEVAKANKLHKHDGLGWEAVSERLGRNSGNSLAGVNWRIKNGILTFKTIERVQKNIRVNAYIEELLTLGAKPRDITRLLNVSKAAVSLRLAGLGLDREMRVEYQLMSSYVQYLLGLLAVPALQRKAEMTRKEIVQALQSRTELTQEEIMKMPGYASAGAAFRRAKKQIPQIPKKRPGVSREESIVLLLPPHQRAILASDAEGMSYKEIASRHNVPLGTAKSRLHRARSAFRELSEKIRIEKEDVEPN